MSDLDVLIIGAGVAGLAAASDLGRAGLSVSIIEARDRIGGRVFTERDRDLSIELGAEFIHGRPPEIWEPLQKAGIEITEFEGESWCFENEQLCPCNFFGEVDSILGEMDDSVPDESFFGFLNRRFSNPTHKPDLENARQHAVRYVSGFNAADPGLVGVHWLVEEMRAEERIEGQRTFRSKNGYEDLLAIFRQQISKSGVKVETGTVAESIRWKAGNVEVGIRRANGSSVVGAPRVLITLPLAVLQASPGEPGAVEFTPGLPKQKLESLERLEMGHVMRIVLRFRERFWDNISPVGNRTLSDMSFLFSEDDLFPTWWTSMPRKLPIITGWAPFRAADRLSGKPQPEVAGQGLRTLGKLLGVDRHQLEAKLDKAYVHDWQADPFSRGAYSYGKVGCDGAQQALGTPVENTIFFAGEATDNAGHNGTVHGAIASGYRAAKEILDGLR